MLTAGQIEAGANFLTETAVNQWLMLIRALPEYRKRPGLYPQLETKLGSLKQGAIAAGNVIKAKVLNAALTQIERVGAGAEKLGSDQSAGVSWSREDNRFEFVRDGVNALYDAPVQRPSGAVRQMTGRCNHHGCLLSACGCSPFGGHRLIF